MENKRAVGTLKEKAAAMKLESMGYVILEHSFRAKTGEIDLVALDGSVLVFAEVKYRTGTTSGLPEESVNAAKQRRIYRTAEMYLLKHPEYRNHGCRFDVVCMDPERITVIKNAFGGM